MLLASLECGSSTAKRDSNCARVVVISFGLYHLGQNAIYPEWSEKKPTWRACP